MYICSGVQLGTDKKLFWLVLCGEEFMIYRGWSLSFKNYEKEGATVGLWGGGRGGGGG